MTLQASFPLSKSQINVELGRAGSAAFSMNGNAERTLAGVPSGSYSFSNYLGKSAAEFLTTTTSQAGTNLTFSSVTLGGAGPSRRIVVSIHWVAAEFNRTVSSVTIGGTAATIHVQDSHSGSEGTPGATSVGVAIVSAVVASGTSGNIVVNFSGSVTGCRLAVARCVAATPFQAVAVQGFLDTSVNTVIDVPSSGVLILAGTGSTNTGGDAMTFGGGTEVYDSDLAGGATGGRFGGTFNAGLSSQTNRAISLNFPSNPADSGCEFAGLSLQIAG